jgi:hypothetical protein
MEYTYWVYSDGIDNRATGHVSACNFRHGPEKKLPEKNPKRCWLGPFHEKHLAAEAGNATGYRFDWCYRCRNYTGELPSWLPPSRGSEHLHRQVPRVPPDRYQGDQSPWRRGAPRAKTGQGADHREIVGELVDDQQHIAPGGD